MGRLKGEEWFIVAVLCVPTFAWVACIIWIMSIIPWDRVGEKLHKAVVWFDAVPLPWFLVFLGTVFLVAALLERRLKRKEVERKLAEAAIQLHERTMRMREQEQDHERTRIFRQELEWGARRFHRAAPHAFNVGEYMRGFMDQWREWDAVFEEKEKKEEKEEKPERKVRVVRILP